MTTVPAGIAVEQAVLRQNVALSVIKASADQDQAIAELLEQSVRTAPVSDVRGANVDTRA